MRLFFAFILSFFWSVGNSTEIFDIEIGYEQGVYVLSEQGQSELNKALTLEKGAMVEKIDVMCWSIDFDDVARNKELSELRLQHIYEALLDHIQDDNNIELVNINRSNSTTNYPQTLARIIIYILEPESKKSANYKELFPEEFPEDETASSYIPQEIEKDVSFDIEDVYFHGNSAEYKRESLKSLKKLYQFMLDNPEVEILIEGHVNGNLGKAYLKEAGRHNPEKVAYKNSTHLSLARARSVRDYLVDKGIDEHRISIDGKGAEEMKYKRPKNRREEEANRRIEVTITKN